MKKYQLRKGLTRREAFTELLKLTQEMSAFTYDPETGIAIVEPPNPPPTVFEKIIRFRSRANIDYDDITP